jgi:DNA mismatch repair protein MutS
MNEQILEHKRNNFLAAVHLHQNKAGIAFLDISTGEFLLAEGSPEYADKLLQSLSPSEVLVQRQKAKAFEALYGDKWYNYFLDDWVFTPEFGNEILLKHFQTNSLKGFGIEEHSLGIIAAGACLHYLRETQHHQLGHINKISRVDHDQFVWLDRFTIRNLELFSTGYESGTALLDVIDHTTGAMGSRLLKRWLALPLKNIDRINERLNAVEYLHNNAELADNLRQKIASIGDLERLISKAAVLRISPRETEQIRKALEWLVPLKEELLASKCAPLMELGEQLNPCSLLVERIASQLVEDAPNTLGKGAVICRGVNAELDELRELSSSSKDFLQEMLERETQKTGISSLKIGFNNVFGYYLEVRNTHKDKAPDDWIRKQTLANAERYITEELKVYETKILSAEGRIAELETRLFNELIINLQEDIIPIQQNATNLASIDCLASFAHTAKENNYNKPTIFEDKRLHILAGRHPVIEKQLSYDENYVPNDVELTPDDQQIIMITGPNMSGKSALLRQTALIVIMAQMGSFVPAEAAHIGLVDKIFTRVGASDNMSAGESTFMVEMNETSSILNNVTESSLVILDEIGRGTSTYDGISIAWAIAEYLHQHPQARCKTLFATHYHELNEMTNQFPRIKNYSIAVKEIGKKIIFLRKLIPGGSEHSFGIHVAKMAGMPKEVIQRAEIMLSELEKSHKPAEQAKIKNSVESAGMQLSIFQLDDPTLQNIKEELIKLDINSLTPVEALMKLNEIKRMVGGK